MKNLIFSFILIPFFQVCSLQAQPPSGVTDSLPKGIKIPNFLERITLRESFLSKNAKTEPAIFTWTNPENDKASWLTKAAIGYSIADNWGTNLILYPYIEFHKNTLIEEEQENFQSGFSAEWQRSLVNRKWSPVLIGALKYNRDVIKNITSFQGSIYFTPLFKGIRDDQMGMFWVPNELTEFGKAFLFTYSPYLGLENENRFRVESAGDEGNIYRAFFRINSSIWFPLTESYFQEKFEVTFDWQYRYNFSENVESLTAEEHNYLTVGINFKIFESDLGSAMVGYNYIYGENPAKNFEEQTYQALTLKVKI